MLTLAVVVVIRITATRTSSEIMGRQRGRHLAGLVVGVRRMATQAARHTSGTDTSSAVTRVLHRLSRSIMRHLAGTKAAVGASGAVATVGFDTRSRVSSVITNVVRLPVDGVLHAVLETPGWAEFPLANTSPNEECKTDRTRNCDENDDGFSSHSHSMGNSGSLRGATLRFLGRCRATRSADNDCARGATYDRSSSGGGGSGMSGCSGNGC